MQALSESTSSESSSSAPEASRKRRRPEDTVLQNFSQLDAAKQVDVLAQLNVTAGRSVAGAGFLRMLQSDEVTHECEQAKGFVGTCLALQTRVMQQFGDTVKKARREQDTQTVNTRLYPEASTLDSVKRIVDLDPTVRPMVERVIRTTTNILFPRDM